MRTADSQLESLLTAFYAAQDCGDFLARAERALGVGLALSKEEDSPCRADVLSNGVYACTVQSDDAEILPAMVGLIQNGIDLFGWFGEIRAAHPDRFFDQNAQLGAGLFCLYFPANMAERANSLICDALAAQTDALHCFREQAGFCLVVQKDARKQAAFFEELEQFVSKNLLFAGVAGPFATPNLAKGGMEKAKEAALFAPSDQKPLRFVSDLRWRLFCAQAEQSLRREGFEIGDFLLHSLCRVLEYDRENATQYYPSMFEYLLCGKNLRRAAERLGIHRNTLDYRIGKMAALFGIDFSDRHTCFELLFSCRLFEETGGRP